jgi:hypothetical protein
MSKWVALRRIWRSAPRSVGERGSIFSSSDLVTDHLSSSLDEDEYSGFEVESEALVRLLNAFVWHWDKETMVCQLLPFHISGV